MTVPQYPLSTWIRSEMYGTCTKGSMRGALGKRGNCPQTRTYVKPQSGGHFSHKPPPRAVPTSEQSWVTQCPPVTYHSVLFKCPFGWKVCLKCPFQRNAWQSLCPFQPNVHPSQFHKIGPAQGRIQQGAEGALVPPFKAGKLMVSERSGTPFSMLSPP